MKNHFSRWGNWGQEWCVEGCPVRPWMWWDLNLVFRTQCGLHLLAKHLLCAQQNPGSVSGKCKEGARQGKTSFLYEMENCCQSDNSGLSRKQFTNILLWLQNQVNCSSAVKKSGQFLPSPFLSTSVFSSSAAILLLSLFENVAQIIWRSRFQCRANSDCLKEADCVHWCSSPSELEAVQGGGIFYGMKETIPSILLHSSDQLQLGQPTGLNYRFPFSARPTCLDWAAQNEEMRFVSTVLSEMEILFHSPCLLNVF